MYVPPAFAERDPDRLFDAVRRHSFGLLVSQHDGEPFATHLPFLVDRAAGPTGCLVGHVARANPHWQHADGQRVMAVFAGPHAYVSPTWYEAADVVPTWNYVAVHVYGTFRAVHDEDAVTRILSDTVETYEAAMPQPWRLDAARDFNRKMARAVVGFRVEITRMEGKWKLNQNHPPERRERVARALAVSADHDARDVAALMRERSADA